MSSTTKDAAPVSLELTRLIGMMSQRLGEHAGAPLGSAPGGELRGLVESVERLQARLDAVKLAAIREVDRNEHAREVGASTTTSWLRAGPARMPVGAASRAVKLGRELEQSLQRTQCALARGALSVEHAQVIATAVTGLPSEAEAWVRSRAEQVLIGHAARFNPTELAKLGQHILDVVDPDLADRVLAKKLAEEEAKNERSRELSLSPDPYRSGLHRLRGTLDAETAEMLKTALDPLAEPRPKDAIGQNDTRTYGRRMGDALHEHLRRALNCGHEVPTHGGTKPHIVIMVDADFWLTGTGYGRYMVSQQPVSMDAIRRIATDALISVIERGAKPGDLEAQARARTVGTHLRLLLEARDRGCCFPGCDRPPAWTDAHHILEWRLGGETRLNNLVLLCGFHHRLIHADGWTIRMNPEDQLPEFVPPSWMDKQRKPLRNTRIQQAYSKVGYAKGAATRPAPRSAPARAADRVRRGAGLDAAGLPSRPRSRFARLLHNPPSLIGRCGDQLSPTMVNSLSAEFRRPAA